MFISRVAYLLELVCYHFNSIVKEIISLSVDTDEVDFSHIEAVEHSIRIAWHRKSIVKI